MPRLSSALRLLAILTWALEPARALSVDCSRILVQGTSYNFNKLDNEYTLAMYRYEDMEDTDKIQKVEFDFNLCKPLKKSDDASRNKCAQFSHICGIASLLDKDGKMMNEAYKHYPVAVAGALTDGSQLDPKWGETSNGLELSLQGKEEGDAPPLMALINFQCIDARSKRNAEVDARKKEEDDKDDDKDDGKGDLIQKHPEWKKELTTDDKDGGKITFQSFKYESREGKTVLRLDWETRHACRDAKDEDSDSSKGGWGFFSWLFFLSFIGLIAYFSFFAWINYTRYGKSGFDMLPHADTLRELPHLIGEFVSKVVNTLRGGHAGGGYSAL